jgi:hypothetical protein
MNDLTFTEMQAIQSELQEKYKVYRDKHSRNMKRW